jgi:hypothetical protein
MRPKFNLGNVTVMTEALCALIASGQDADFFLQKHVGGDWGFCGPAGNEQALREGLMVSSRYRTLWGKEIVVRTFLAKGETFLYCECDPVAINHGFVYDTGPYPPGEKGVYDTAPPVIPGFKYNGNFGPLSETGGTASPLYNLPGLVPPTTDPGPAPKETESINPELAFKYDAGEYCGHPGFSWRHGNATKGTMNGNVD